MAHPVDELNDAPPLGRGAVAVTVGVGVALLAIVVLATASAGGDLGGGRTILVDQALSGFVAGGMLVVFVVGLALWVLRLRGGLQSGRERKPRLPWWARSLVGFGLLALIIFAWSVAVGHSHDRRQTKSRTAQSIPERFGIAPDPPPAPRDEDGPAFYVGMGLAVLASLAVASVVARRWRLALEPDDADPALPDDPDPTPLAAALAASLDDLLGQPDPRRAVIAAYARMQAELARVGVTRLPSETEPELLRRALGALGAEAEPARRLTDLFERARYSEHAVDEAMRDAAIAAVRELRDGLLVAR